MGLVYLLFLFALFPNDVSISCYCFCFVVGVGGPWTTPLVQSSSPTHHSAPPLAG
ncbi:hypothetical protein BT96DRAFT_923452 [Gymnopus androsaceus JB14]|uniref:Uncharacterized protein n=1 Tax=Gymnopus androsaceus JB14 TaxID=1447944 RepID=A0A6A4HBW3_9AGAR|nr:hypothetical protein BT96DRAFT_923452 [Gymnopus androsaceus JB14]